MSLLDGRVALVTGASRGIGRGAAIELARQGAQVAIAARTLSPAMAQRIDTDGAMVGGSLEEVAQQIIDEGGQVTPFACDLREEEQVGTLVEGVIDAFGRIDILVNNGMPQHTMTGRFWEMPLDVYDSQMTVGPRSYYITSRNCAPQMISQGSGIIVNISSPGSCVDFFSAAYGVARAASDRMAQAFASDLQDTGVRAYSLWPPFVRTERVQMALNGQEAGFDMPEGFDPSKEANSTEMVGLGIAHLAADANEAERNGTVVTLAELADMYGFTDLDGRPSMRHQYVDYSISEFGRVLPLAFTKITK